MIIKKQGFNQRAKMRTRSNKIASMKDNVNTCKRNENVPDMRKGKKYLKEKIIESTRILENQS